MSDTATPAAPTADDIRNARHAGFGDSVAHMPEKARGQITDRYKAQDARREENVSSFYNQVLGDE